MWLLNEYEEELNEKTERLREAETDQVDPMFGRLERGFEEITGRNKQERENLF